jgi:hypothetical protein
VIIASSKLIGWRGRIGGQLFARERGEAPHAGELAAQNMELPG